MTQDTRARKEIVSTNFGHIRHSLTVFRYAMLKIQIARSQNLLPKFWHTSYVLPKAAQNVYAPFTKNRREIVVIQKNDRLGFYLKRPLAENEIFKLDLPAKLTAALINAKRGSILSILCFCLRHTCRRPWNNFVILLLLLSGGHLDKPRN
jgi:hypothetical protein